MSVLIRQRFKTSQDLGAPAHLQANSRLPIVSDWGRAQRGAIEADRTGSPFLDAGQAENAEFPDQKTDPNESVSLDATWILALLFPDPRRERKLVDHTAELQAIQRDLLVYTERDAQAPLLEAGRKALEHIRFAETIRARDAWDGFVARLERSRGSEPLSQSDWSRLWSEIMKPLAMEWLELGSGNDAVSILVHLPGDVARRHAEQYARLAQQAGHKVESDLLGAIVYPESWPLHLRWQEDAHKPAEAVYPAHVVDMEGARVLLHIGERQNGRHILFERIARIDGCLEDVRPGTLVRVTLDESGNVANVEPIQQYSLDSLPRSEMTRVLADHLNDLWKNYLR